MSKKQPSVAEFEFHGNVGICHKIGVGRVTCCVAAAGRLFTKLALGFFLFNSVVGPLCSFMAAVTTAAAAAAAAYNK